MSVGFVAPSRTVSHHVALGSPLGGRPLRYPDGHYRNPPLLPLSVASRQAWITAGTSPASPCQSKETLSKRSSSQLANGPRHSSRKAATTPGKQFLDQKSPFITCEAGSTKNRKSARQYIQTDLARELQEHVDELGGGRKIFQMPHSTDVARMLRGDLAAARKAWLKQSEGNPKELKRRTESDFLCEQNHDGKVLDFHSLRHTCGAWLAISGAHPKAVQANMQHSTIVLTMDTYGHLFPGQEAESIARLPRMMGEINLTPRRVKCRVLAGSMRFRPSRAICPEQSALQK